uniref:Uncharacterized protein n=1 Tax=Rhizophora mucronata TaxID=61149 RepID=A0A2P2QF63_RHIMU
MYAYTFTGLGSFTTSNSVYWVSNCNHICSFLILVVIGVVASLAISM